MGSLLKKKLVEENFQQCDDRLTEGGSSFEALLGPNILTDEAIRNLRIKNVDINKFVRDFEKFIIESFQKCYSGSTNSRDVLSRLIQHKDKALREKFNYIPKLFVFN